MLVKDCPIKIQEYIKKRCKEIYREECEVEHIAEKRISELFDWENSLEGWSFWNDLNSGKFETFYKKYRNSNFNEIKLDLL